MSVEKVKTWPELRSELLSRLKTDPREAAPDLSWDDPIAESQGMPQPDSRRNGRAPSANEYRQKSLKSRVGPDRPLATLAGKEIELHEQTAALAKLDEPNQRRPNRNLPAYQLQKLASAAFGQGSHLSATLKAEVVALYASLQSKDVVEAMIDQQLVALNVMQTDSLTRACFTGNWRAREVEMRTATKASSTFADLVKLREARRGQMSTGISVGKVNVESGGNAIVGNVGQLIDQPKSELED